MASYKTKKWLSTNWVYLVVGVVAVGYVVYKYVPSVKTYVSAFFNLGK